MPFSHGRNYFVVTFNKVLIRQINSRPGTRCVSDVLGSKRRFSIALHFLLTLYRPRAGFLPAAQRLGHAEVLCCSCSSWQDFWCNRETFAFWYIVASFLFGSKFYLQILLVNFTCFEFKSCLQIFTSKFYLQI